MGGGGGNKKGVHPVTDNEQTDPKKQKSETSEVMPREKRLDMFIATRKDLRRFRWPDHVDLSGPHPMTMREFASIQLDNIEHQNFDLEVDYSNISDNSVVLRLYDPEANIMDGEEMLPEITECSRKAIGEYNESNVILFGLLVPPFLNGLMVLSMEHPGAVHSLPGCSSRGTHFDLKRVLKANVEALCPYQYYITFEAHDATRDFTQSFQAIVAICFPTTKQEVQLVQIRKPLRPFCPPKAMSQLFVN
ncbi:hypothetical protein OROMI_011717 [Orobanche minor]